MSLISLLEAGFVCTVDNRTVHPVSIMHQPVHTAIDMCLMAHALCTSVSVGKSFISPGRKEKL